jgi:transposase
VTNYVVQPQDRDERGKGVKNNRIDAQALCQRLDRYVRGNRKAFSVVRVPNAEEERERAISRQRQQLVRERQRLQAMGRSLLAMHGIHVSGKWWQGKTWSKIRSEAPEWVIERLNESIADQLASLGMRIDPPTELTLNERGEVVIETGSPADFAALSAIMKLLEEEFRLI